MLSFSQFSMDFSPWKIEKKTVYKHGEKFVIFSKKNAGTWKMNSVVPDVPADYVGRPPRPGKMVELLSVEEACRMRETRWEERGKFFLQICGQPGTRRTWSRMAAMLCDKVLDPARGACNAVAPEATNVRWVCWR